MAFSTPASGWVSKFFLKNLFMDIYLTGILLYYPSPNKNPNQSNSYCTIFIVKLNSSNVKIFRIDQSKNWIFDISTEDSRIFLNQSILFNDHKWVDALVRKIQKRSKLWKTKKILKIVPLMKMRTQM